MRHPHLLATLSILATLLLIACATIQETGESRFMITSPAQETQMGIASFNELKKSQKISHDPAANELVNRVANRLTPHVLTDVKSWEVLVFDDPTPNAFALPGGKIGVHTGILPITQNDAGLAAVIGHELAHVSLRHGGQRVSRQMAAQGLMSIADIGLAMNDTQQRPLIMSGLGLATTYGAILPFSRDNELEADRWGMIYMAKAGYDPAEAVGLWKRMKAYSEKTGGKPPEWMSTHPADDNRIRQLEQLLPQVRAEYYKGATFPAQAPATQPTRY